MTFNKDASVTVYLFGGHVFTGVLAHPFALTSDADMCLKEANFKYGETDSRADVGTVIVERSKICAISKLKG